MQQQLYHARPRNQTTIPSESGLARVLRPFYALALPTADEDDFRRAERAARSYCMEGPCKAPDLLFVARRALVRLFGLPTFTSDPPAVWQMVESIKSRPDAERGAA